MPQRGETRVWRTLNGGSPCRFNLDDESWGQFVTLEWGTYLFVPSLAALRRLTTAPQGPASAGESGPGPDEVEQVEQGKALIEWLDSLDGEEAKTEWKVALEDRPKSFPRDRDAIWAAIRAAGGAMRTDYGVLVGDWGLIKKVLREDETYSVEGYAERMRKSYGEIYLGMDSGDDYSAQSKDTNQALLDYGEAQAFLVSRKVTQGVVARWLQAFEGKGDELTFQIRDLLDYALAGLCDIWFGIPDGVHVAPGARAPWDQPQPVCPGHYTAPSRYFFSPYPGDVVQALGKGDGKALREATLKLVEANRSSPDKQGQIGAKMFASIADDEQLASTLIGVMMGFLPTVDGNFLTMMNRFIDPKSLWRMQADLMSQPSKNAHQRAKDNLEAPVREALQHDPIPHTIWRTAKSDAPLGPVEVGAGDRIVLGLSSAMRQNLDKKSDDVPPVFGGQRAGDSHPTHACPAYEMAMGVLMGMLSGLLETGTLRPYPAPLILTLDATTSPLRPQPPSG